MCKFSQGGQAMRPGSWGWWGLSHFVAVDDAQASSTVSGGEDLSHGWGKHITGWGLCTGTEETRKGERAQQKVKARVGLKMAQTWNVFFYTHWSTGWRKKPYWLKVFEYKLSPITGRLLSYEETQPTPREPGLKLKMRKKQKLSRDTKGSTHPGKTFHRFSLGNLLNKQKHQKERTGVEVRIQSG